MRPKRRRSKKTHHRPPTRGQLERLVAAAIVDAYGEAEERTGLFTMLDDHLAVPFHTELLGVPVTVERIDVTGTGEIVAICRRGNLRQAVAILDLPLPTLPTAGVERYLRERSLKSKPRGGSAPHQLGAGTKRQRSSVQTGAASCRR